MKISLKTNVRREQGVALLITIIIVLVSAATLASFLLVTENESSSVSRSQIWNNSMTLTEAGVEEAMAFVNKYEGSFSMITNWATAASAAQDGWTVNGNVFTMTRVLATNMGYYTVTITNSNPYSPTISSAGYAYSYYTAAPSPFMVAQIGVNPRGSSTTTSASVGRAVSVTAVRSSLFPDAIDARTNIDLNGNNVRVDSFNSTNAALSDMNTNLGYGTYDINKASYHGNVATDSGIVGAISVGQADIYGTINTGPGGTATVGNNGYVGPLPMPNGASGIQPGYSNSTMNVTFPNVVLPPGATSWTTFSGTTISASGYYYMSGIGNGGLDIEAPNVTIYVNGNISISGNDSITVGTNVVNASLYVSGPSVDIAGNGLVNNPGRASAFSLYGLPSLTSIRLHGNMQNTGTIYSPEADFQFGGGGNDTMDFIGAVVVNSVKLNGHANFHYDESLANIGPTSGYVPVNWTEVGAN